jgi:hypothetical protein
VARITATPKSARAPVTVTFDASQSSDADGSIVSYKFDFDNGTPTMTSSVPKASSTYTKDEDFKGAAKVVPELGDPPKVLVTLKDLKAIGAQRAA